MSDKISPAAKQDSKKDLRAFNDLVRRAEKKNALIMIIHNPKIASKQQPIS